MIFKKITNTSIADPANMMKALFGKSCSILPVLKILLDLDIIVSDNTFYALLQPLWHSLRNELVSQLIPVFLANHPNSGSVLHYVWHGQVSISYNKYYCCFVKCCKC